MDRKIAVEKAIITRYLPNGYFEGIVGCETAVGITDPTEKTASGYTASSALTQYVRSFQELRAFNDEVNMICYNNYFTGSTTAQNSTLTSALRTYKWELGGPDSLYDEGGTTGRKVGIGLIGSPTLIDYRGTLAMQVGDQVSGFDIAGFSASGLLNWSKNTAWANHCFWLWQTDPEFTATMDYIAANPTAGFITTRPAGY
jgi:hypothetical protein